MGSADKIENRENQQKQRGSEAQSSKPRISQRAPQRREQPADAAKSQIEKHEKSGDAENQSLPHVAQNVMAHLVSDHRDDFRRGFFGNGGVPHHDALGSASPLT